MKIAFSTLACPEESWQDIYSIAKDAGFDGIEMRGLGKNVFAARGLVASEAAIDGARDKLKAIRISIPCFSSDCCLGDADKTEENRALVLEYIEWARRFGSDFVRVLGDRDVYPAGDIDDELVISQLRELSQAAEHSGVTLLIETNGAYAETSRLRKLLEAVASDSVGVLWDIHHPYRVFGESPETTVQNLGAYIKYVHAKDSVIENGKPSYRLMGEGDLPVREMMMALRSINYEGYVSLEWVKRWASELEDAGIVFPHFVNYMKQYLGRPAAQGALFDNDAKTGKYIWEKETLIDLTFPQLLDRIADEFPDQYAFRYTTLDYARTYRQFNQDVNAFARALSSLGVKRGDKVSVWATNVPEWYITFWATVKIGAILVTVNTAYKIHEAEFLLRQSDTHTLVMIESHKDSDYASTVREICPELLTRGAGEALHAKRLPFLRNVITVGFKMQGCLTWDQAMRRETETPAEYVYQRMALISQHDVCNIQYTSGTTGFPKGVMLTHHNVINNGKNIGDRMDFSTADKLMIQVPMFHCFGLVLAMTAAVTHGSTMCPLPHFSPKQSLDCVNKEKITAFHGVPTMFIAMMEHEDFAKTDFSSVRTGIMAGSVCPPKVRRDAMEKMNMTGLTVVYGQTESSPGCTMNRMEDPIDERLTTVGRALPGAECKIVDIHTGLDLPDGADGEFVARGYNIMKGYYKMPEATASVVDENGWLHTGDL
ncbi:MAG: AMP-binding protein, partial [Defluviitaleaceae bacterium]|nr:AMP-binding protein [Defluviitaleaceae bacterium]